MIFKIRLYYVIVLFLIISILISYGQVRTHGFVEYDDNAYITKNYHVKSGLSIRNILWAFTSGHSANWHPFTWISHMLDVQIFGMNSGYHHLMSLFFHTINTLLWFYLFNKISRKQWQSAFVAALFAIHPLHVGSVAWISERKDVLSTLLWVLTMISYVWYREKPSIERYFPVLILYVFGLMTKPMLVTLPFVLILMDYWPLKRFDKVRRLNVKWFGILKDKVPLFILSTISCIITYHVQQASGAVELSGEYPFQIRMANAAISYVAYIQKLIWPMELTGFYPHPGSNINMVKSIVMGISLVLLSIAIIINRKKYEYIGVGWLWYIGTLIPVIGLVQVGEQALADRYTYVPLIGLYIIIAWGAPILIYRIFPLKTLLSVMSMTILSALMACTWNQVRHWENDFTFFSHMDIVTENNYIAQHGLGVAFLKIGDPESAILYFNKALQSNPDYKKTYGNLGLAFMTSGNIDRAMVYFRKAIEMNPNNVVTMTNYGVAFAVEGNFERAAVQFREAIRIQPDYAVAYYNLAMTMDEIKETKLVYDYLNKAIEIDPTYLEARNYLANILLRNNQWRQSLEHYQIILQLKPDKPKIHNNVGIAFAAMNNPSKAIYHFEKALEIDPHAVNARHNLAVILSEGKAEFSKNRHIFIIED